MNRKLLILLIAILCFANGNAYSVIDNADNSIIFQELKKSEQDFTISPNPASSKIKINLKKVSSKTVLTVFDVLGKKVMSKELSQLESTVDVSQWNNGVYLVRITSDKDTQTKRFVKQ